VETQQKEIKIIKTITTPADLALQIYEIADGPVLTEMLHVFNCLAKIENMDNWEFWAVKEAFEKLCEPK